MLLFLTYCFEEVKSPIEAYKGWLEDKNWFGKLYVCITIIITIPDAIFYYISSAIFGIILLIYVLGLKNK